jgi:hypothetical protein
VRSLWVGLLLASAALGSAQIIAYRFPAISGNQSFGGALGMDFNVNEAIYVTALGVFDSAQNGIQNNLDCLIYDRVTQQVVASKFFSPSSQGIGDGTTNFLDLNSPVLLPAGFQGAIVAQGYGILEKNGNSYSASATYATQLNDGGGLITFTGQSRHGNFGAFPTTADLNVAQYGAGNFKYLAASPVPEPATLAVLGLALIAVRRRVRE